jgi:hypothetical protein
MDMQEFHLAAQTWEYIVGLLGLIFFVLFWKFVNGTSKYQRGN